MTYQKFPNMILGTAQLSMPYGVTNYSLEEKSVEEAYSILRCAKTHQIEVVDTAPAYGNSEELIGSSAIHFNIHSKLDKSIHPEESLKNSLKRLRVEEIELLYAHDIDAFRANPKLITQSLLKLRDERVRNIGVSLYDLDDLELVLEFPEISHIQVPMNLLDQRFAGDTLRRIHEHGLKCIVRSAFLQGSLLAEPEELPKKIHHLYPFLRSLRNELNLRNIPPLEGCLAFVGYHNDLNGLIIGAQNVDELTMVMKAWDLVQSLRFDLEWLREWPLPPAAAVDPRQW